MIYEPKMYAATCDNCGNSWEHLSDGFVALADKTNLIEELYEHGWHIGDGVEGEKDKCYCDDCWERDNDNDAFVIIIKDLKTGDK